MEQLSVGTVLQWLVLKDLYKTNMPELYDFGISAEYNDDEDRSHTEPVRIKGEG